MGHREGAPRTESGSPAPLPGPRGPSLMSGEKVVSQTEQVGPKPDWSVDTPGHVLKSLAETIGLFRKELITVRSRLVDMTRPVDEYNVPGPAPSPLTVKADFDTVDELITSIVVITPLTATIASFNGSALQVANPTPGQIISSVNIPASMAGIPLTVAWEVMVRGTLAAGDADNFALLIGATQLAVSSNALNAGTVYPQEPVQFTVPVGGGVLSIQAIGAGTAGTVYQAGMTATDLSGSTGVSLTLGNRVWTLPAGTVTLAPISLILSKTDPRSLSWSGGGTGSLELMGFAYGGAG